MYSLYIERYAIRQLKKINKNDSGKIKSAIEGLSTDPRPPGCKKLRGTPAWRIRAGEYRIIYEIHDDTLIVLVISIGHRKSIYK